jgi:integrase
MISSCRTPALGPRPWTVSGFNSSFIKAVAALRRSGKVNAGLTFHGLRHTCGNLLIEAGFDIDTVPSLAGPENIGDGDPLFQNRGHQHQDARRVEKV